MNFIAKLRQAIQKNDSLLCIGLDPDPGRMPQGVNIAKFNREIIDATADLVCAYKPNLAFYEGIGIDGLYALQDTVKHIPDDIPIIADAKRGDIGNTARAYAMSVFDNFGFDAVTVNPYLGFDSIEPFIQYKDKGIFILCRTSNEGALDFQSLRCEVDNFIDLGSDRDHRPLFEIVALKARQWNMHNNLGLVIGATYPDELKLIRASHPSMPLLIPGVGAQGGDLAAAVRYGMDSRGEMAIINSSRQVIYASRSEDFAEAARRVASELRQQINHYRTTPGT